MTKKIKLNTKFKFDKEIAQKLPHKFYSAVIDYTFFWKEQKILSFFVPFTIAPWGLTEYSKEIVEITQIGDINNYPAIKNFYNKKHNIAFYMAINIKHQGFSKENLFWLWYYPFIKTKNKNIFPDYEKMQLKKFEEVIKKNIFDHAFLQAENVFFKIVAVLENLMGPLIEFTPKMVYNCSKINIPEDNLSNFCIKTEKKVKINLDNYFSAEEIKLLLEEIEITGPIKNPFPGEIETSVEEYKEFLLTLVGPEKWEYTNLEIEKLNLSIEELFFLFFNLKTQSSNPFLQDEPFGTLFLEDKDKISSDPSLATNYFWYKLKQTILNLEQKPSCPN